MLERSRLTHQECRNVIRDRAISEEGEGIQLDLQEDSRPERREAYNCIFNQARGCERLDILEEF
jgi:hypothetical protein